jgi:hypothetical protein
LKGSGTSINPEVILQKSVRFAIPEAEIQEFDHRARIKPADVREFDQRARKKPSTPGPCESIEQLSQQTLESEWASHKDPAIDSMLTIIRLARQRNGGIDLQSLQTECSVQSPRKARSEASAQTEREKSQREEATQTERCKYAESSTQTDARSFAECSVQTSQPGSAVASIQTAQCPDIEEVSVQTLLEFPWMQPEAIDKPVKRSIGGLVKVGSLGSTAADSASVSSQSDLDLSMTSCADDDYEKFDLGDIAIEDEPELDMPMPSSTNKVMYPMIQSATYKHLINDGVASEKRIPLQVQLLPRSRATCVSI